MKKIFSLFLIIFLLVIIVASSAQCAIIQESVFGYLSDKSIQVGNEFIIGQQYKLFDVTYDNTSTSMNQYNSTDHSIMHTWYASDYPNSDLMSDTTIILSADMHNFLNNYGGGDYNFGFYRNTYEHGLAKDSHTYQIMNDEYWALINRSESFSIFSIFNTLNVNNQEITLDFEDVFARPIPETTTILLLGFGLLSIAGVIRKK